MSDRSTAQALDVSDPVRDFDHYVDKYRQQGLEGEELWGKIMDSGTRPNRDVNRSLGLDD